MWLTLVTNFTLNGLWSLTLTIYLYNVIHPYTVVTGAFGLVALLQTLNFVEESEYCYFSSLVLSAIGCLIMLINESNIQIMTQNIILNVILEMDI